jgi:hypothetical protein
VGVRCDGKRWGSSCLPGYSATARATVGYTRTRHWHWRDPPTLLDWHGKRARQGGVGKEKRDGEGAWEQRRVMEMTKQANPKSGSRGTTTSIRQQRPLLGLLSSMIQVRLVVIGDNIMERVSASSWPVRSKSRGRQLLQLRDNESKQSKGTTGERAQFTPSTM